MRLRIQALKLKGEKILDKCIHCYSLSFLSEWVTVDQMKRNELMLKGMF